jgi:signal transduction histidine kinase
LLGVLALDRHDPAPPFTEQHQEILALFADQAAIAIENARLYQDVERQRREVEIVDDLSRKLNATLDLDTVLQRVVEGAKELTGSDLAQIALRDDQTDTLEFRYRAGSHSSRLQTHRIERGKGIGGKVMVTGQPFRTSRYAEDPRITKDYLARTLAEDVIAELAVPFQTEGRVEGVLFVDNRSPRAFTERNERTLLRLADHAAIAIRNARLHVTAVQRAEQLATLSELTQALTAELDPHFVTRRILEAVQVLIPHAAGLLLEQPEDAKTFRVLAHIGLQRSPDRTSFHLPADTGLAGMATETRQPVVSTDIAQDPLFVGRAWAAAEGLVSGIVLPFGYGDRVIGVLSVFLRRPHTFADEEINLLRSFAAQGAVALENARLFEQVRLGRERLLHLAQQVLSAQEEERRRLARELHDEAGQALTALRISLGLIRDDLHPEAALLRQRLGEAVNLTESITDQLRLLAHALHPPALKTLGLHKTIEGQCREFSRLTQLPIDYAGTDLPSLPDSVGIHLYRFLQEAITNVRKHAKAHRVSVALEAADDMISLTVEDDGVGFDATAQLRDTVPNGIGLLGMRERLDLLKGRLEIASQPGQGTRLVARVPWRGGP